MGLSRISFWVVSNYKLGDDGGLRQTMMSWSCVSSFSNSDEPRSIAQEGASRGLSKLDRRLASLEGCTLRLQRYPPHTKILCLGKDYGRRRLLRRRLRGGQLKLRHLSRHTQPAPDYCTCYYYSK